MQKTGLSAGWRIKEVCCFQEATTVSIRGPEIGLKTGLILPRQKRGFYFTRLMIFLIRVCSPLIFNVTEFVL